MPKSRNQQLLEELEREKRLQYWWDGKLLEANVLEELTLSSDENVITALRLDREISNTNKVILKASAYSSSTSSVEAYRDLVQREIPTWEWATTGLHRGKDSFVTPDLRSKYAGVYTLADKPELDFRSDLPVDVDWLNQQYQSLLLSVGERDYLGVHEWMMGIRKKGGSIKADIWAGDLDKVGIANKSRRGIIELEMFLKGLIRDLLHCDLKDGEIVSFE